MASLIDLLIDDLNNEDTGYNKLLDLSNDKTSAIVKGDVDELQKIFLQAVSYTHLTLPTN